MIRGVRDPRQHDDQRLVDAEISDNRGVVLLGAPICGTADFVDRHLRAIVAKAEKYVARLQALLLPDHFEEYQQLIRMTLPGRFAHVCRAVVPKRVVEPAKAFDDLQLRAYAAGIGQLSSQDIPVRETVFMQQGAGGRGFREMALDCYSLYDGAWAQSAHRLATRWSPHSDFAALRDIANPAGTAYGFVIPSPQAEESLARFGLDHRDQLWRSHALLRRLEHRVHQPSSFGDGTMLDQLRPTGVRAPAEPIPDLGSYSSTTRSRLTSELAAYTTAFRFENVMDMATPRGRAQVRDMSVAGAGAWLRSRPPRADEERPRFSHFQPDGARIEHRAALLLRLPGSSYRCHGCGRDGWSSYAHLGVCPCGVRSTPVLHHPVKHTLLEMLRSVLPAACVLDGDAAQSRHQRVHGDGEWWRSFSAFKRPDIVVLNFPRTGVHTIIDVKTFDAAGASHVRDDHTDYFTRGAHRELERGLLGEYTSSRDRSGRVLEHHSRQRAIGTCELVCAAVSRQGAMGEQLMTLITRLAGMHAQRVRDGVTSSYSFVEVWRHRISLCVHTQCSQRMLALVSGDVGAAEPETGGLDFAEGVSALWAERWFDAIGPAGARATPEAADDVAREAVAVMRERAREGDGDDGASTVAESEPAGDDDVSTVAESEHAGGDGGDVEALFREVIDELEGGRDEGAADARADAEVAAVVPEVAAGSHRPTHPERLSSGPAAPIHFCFGSAAGARGDASGDAGVEGGGG